MLEWCSNCPRPASSYHSIVTHGDRVSFNVSTLRWQQNPLIFMVSRTSPRYGRTMAEWLRRQIARDHMLKAATMSAWRATQSSAKSNRDFLTHRHSPQAAIHALDRPVEMNLLAISRGSVSISSFLRAKSGRCDVRSSHMVRDVTVATICLQYKICRIAHT